MSAEHIEDIGNALYIDNVNTTSSSSSIEKANRDVEVMEDGTIGSHAQHVLPIAGDVSGM